MLIKRVRRAKNRPRRASGTRSPIRLLHIGDARWKPAKYAATAPIRIARACCGKKYGSQMIGSQLASWIVTPASMSVLRRATYRPAKADTSCETEPSSDGRAANIET